MILSAKLSRGRLYSKSGWSFQKESRLVTIGGKITRKVRALTLRKGEMMK